MSKSLSFLLFRLVSGGEGRAASCGDRPQEHGEEEVVPRSPGQRACDLLAGAQGNLQVRVRTQVMRAWFACIHQNGLSLFFALVPPITTSRQGSH